MRVALFATCVTDTFYPDTARAVVTLLARLGVDVDFPLAQTCCGQMHFNTGYPKPAADLATRYAEVFAGYDAVVAPSGSCAGMVREVYPGLRSPLGRGRPEDGGFPSLRWRSATVQPPSAALPRSGQGTPTDGPRTYELTEFIVDVLGVTDVGAYFPHRVTYHPTCHSLRMLGVGDRPLRLLRAVRGLRLTELPEADSCCGFGGTFAVKNADTSLAMLGDKMRAVVGTGAEILTAGDNSCLMHIGGGLSRQRAGVRTLHLAEILASTEEEPWTPNPATPATPATR